MCGISGYSGANKPNFDKLKLLGLLNQERGEDSAGIAYNGYITRSPNSYLTVLKTLVFPEFDSDYHVCISHARKRSIGAVSVENTHPFPIYKNEEDESDPNKYPDMFFAHNGTISNIKELATKYGVDHSFTSTDSETLGKIILRAGTDVLKEYIGGASCCWTIGEDLYIWNGASKNTCHSKECSVERDLYYIKDNDKNFWFSSQKDHLQIIFNQEKIEPLQVPENTILKIRKGRIISKKPIERTGTQTETYVSNNNSNNWNRGGNIKSNKFSSVIEKSEEGAITELMGLYFSGSVLLNGVVYVNTADYFITTHEDPQALKLYFKNGVMLKDEVAYAEYCEKSKSTHMTTQDKALYTHPLTIASGFKELKESTNSKYAYMLGKDGKPDGTSSYKLKPLFGSFLYSVDSGFISEYNSSESNPNVKDLTYESVYLLYEIMKEKSPEMTELFDLINNEPETPENDAKGSALKKVVLGQIKEYVDSIFDIDKGIENSIFSDILNDFCVFHEFFRKEISYKNLSTVLKTAA